MNKFDRITAILIHLQTRSVVTAIELADRFEVSERTIYRDLRTLETAGVPLCAEPGVGYYLKKDYRLPPVMFTGDEAAALLIGAKIVSHRLDKATFTDFTSALDKVKAILPLLDREHINAIEKHIAVFSPQQLKQTAAEDQWLAQCRVAMSRTQVMDISYTKRTSLEAEQRLVEPIGLYFYSDHWHLIAWCRLRSDYRDFRLDRIQTLSLISEQFSRRDRATLDEYLQRLPNERRLYPIKLRFRADAARFVGEQKYFFGFLEETITPVGIEMTFLCAYVEHMARWLMQFAHGLELLEGEELRVVMKQLVMDLQAQWLDAESH